MDQAKPTWTTPSWPRCASWPGPVAPTATGRAGRCSKRRGIEACPKLSRASSCLFLGRSRSTSLRHPRFPRIGGFHEQRPPVTGIIILSPGNASRLGLDRMRFMSFHVCRRGDLYGYSPSPEELSSAQTYGCQRLRCTFAHPTAGHDRRTAPEELSFTGARQPRPRPARRPLRPRPWPAGPGQLACPRRLC